MTADTRPTALGRLPSDWDVQPLGKVVERTAKPVDVDVAGSYREIGIRSHGKGVFHKDAVEGIALGSKRVFEVVPNCLVFNIVFAWEGAVAVTSERERGMIASHRFPMFGPTPAALVDVEFLRRFFQTETGVRLLGEASPGGAGRNRTLNQKLTAEIPVPVPPLGEQRKIAAILSAVDDAIEAMQAVIGQVQVVKKAMMAELLTRGLPGRYTRFRMTEVGEIPESWKTAPLGDLAHVQTGLAKGKPVENTVALPYLRVANVQDGYVDLTEMKLITVDPRQVERYSLQRGDVLFTEGGDADKLGRGCVWQGQISPCLHQNHVFAVRPNAERLLPEFLATFAASVQGRAYFLDCAKQTTNLASINSSQLRAFPVPVPPIEEQRGIVDALGSLHERATTDAATLGALREAKVALTTVLLKGEVRVEADRGTDEAAA